MCWNADVSIKTWLFAITIFIIGFMYGFPLRKLIFILIFSNIQLIEYFLWKNLGNKELNEFYSKIGFANISLEPIGACLMIDNIQLRIFSIIIYSIFLLIYLYLYGNKINYSTTQTRTGFLYWNSLQLEGFYIYYVILWFLFFLGGVLLSKDIVIIIVTFSTLFYTIYNKYYHRSLPSYWCSISNILWLYVLGFVLLKIFRK